MKHPSTRRLFDYWNERRGDRPAPERGEIDPADIRHALGDTFMLTADFIDELRFRLAGTRVCALFCREIKGEAFASLWGEASRSSIGDLLTVVTNETIGAVAGVVGRTAEGAEIDLEMLLLPFAYVGHARIRALGVLAPIVPPFWLGENPLVTLELGPLRHLGIDLDHGAPSIAAEPVPDGGRTHHGFVVYSGGRAPSGDRTD